MCRRNARIAAAATAHRFEETAPVPFLCECSDERCTEILRMPLGLYRRARDGGDYLVAPGHQVEAARIVRVREHCWVYCIAV
ncbi:MAG: hypothetical protein ACXVQQ_02675 [Gaiellaceae bacterium]